MAMKKSQPVAVPAPPAPPSSKKRVPFVVKVDGAREVVLKGPGEWGAQLELPPGEYQYRLIVDGEWRDDPKGPKKVPNPFGTQNCVLIVA